MFGPNTVYNQKQKEILVKSKSSKVKLNKIFLILGILIIIPSAYVTNLVYKSLKGQMFLLKILILINIIFQLIN